MQVISKVKKLCSCCMEEHEVQVVELEEKGLIKGKKVSYRAVYMYCDVADEFYMLEDQIEANDIALKNAYRKQAGLLTTKQIVDVREKFNISQKDLCMLLGWGENTITRYEGHQIQDRAHDTILRKIAAAPEWFLELLESGKEQLQTGSYEKYRNKATEFYGMKADSYKKKADEAEYIQQHGERPMFVAEEPLEYTTDTMTHI